MKKLLAFGLYRVPLVHTVFAKVLYAAQFPLLGFYKDAETVRLIRSIYAETKCLVQPFEAHLIYSLARMQAGLQGSMAEVGTYEGATAKLICTAKQNRRFFGFDTFEGLPETQAHDTSHGQTFFRKNKYTAGYEHVQAYLSGFTGVQLVKGLFPASGKCVENERFSFVHLDMDLYQGTKDALEFFWPRLVEHGLVVIHDSHTGGVSQAIREFTTASGAPSFTAFGSQSVLVKRSAAGPANQR